MTNFTRQNAWNNGGTFANLDLLWYARGVGVLQSLPLDNPNSWWFFAAIHGQPLTTAAATSRAGWRFIPGPPQVPITPLPSQALQDLYWDQCQHQSWYFPPWHRGYLIALEEQIRTAIVDLGGPTDWALPYWNYLGPDSQNMIPPAFAEQTLPDGTLNPLFVRARYGPNEDGNVFITTDVNEDCQSNTVYTGNNADTPSPGYGGPSTGFWHGGNIPSGNLEQNPHNPVHVEVGSRQVGELFRVGLVFASELDAGLLSVDLRNVFEANGNLLSAQAAVGILQPGIWRLIDGGQDYFINTTPIDLQVLDFTVGLMSDPRTAALDPIFYLHHANIDRMWAAWNTLQLNNSNPTDPKWLAGPKAIGEREFAMPMSDGSSWTFTPADVNNLSQLDYTYDDLSVTVLPRPAAIVAAQRLMRLGVASAAALATQGENMDGRENTELLGANDETLQIKSSGSRTIVKLDSEVQGRMFASLATAAETNKPDHTYLRLENVRGSIDAFKLKVSVNRQNVGTIALFGLHQASLQDGQHGGVGLTFEFDITNIFDDLYLANAIDVNSLDVRIEPNHPFADLAQLTVGRVSVYRQ